MQGNAEQQRLLQTVARNREAVRMAERAYNKHPGPETEYRLRNARERLEWTRDKARTAGLLV